MVYNRKNVLNDGCDGVDSNFFKNALLTFAIFGVLGSEMQAQDERNDLSNQPNNHNVTKKITNIDLRAVFDNKVGVSSQEKEHMKKFDNNVSLSFLKSLPEWGSFVRSMEFSYATQMELDNIQKVREGNTETIQEATKEGKATKTKSTYGDYVAFANEIGIVPKSEHVLLESLMDNTKITNAFDIQDSDWLLVAGTYQYYARETGHRTKGTDMSSKRQSGSILADIDSNKRLDGVVKKDATDMSIKEGYTWNPTGEKLYNRQLSVVCQSVIDHGDGLTTDHAGLLRDYLAKRVANAEDLTDRIGKDLASRLRSRLRKLAHSSQDPDVMDFATDFESRTNTFTPVALYRDRKGQKELRKASKKYSTTVETRKTHQSFMESMRARMITGSDPLSYLNGSGLAHMTDLTPQSFATAFGYEGERLQSTIDTFVDDLKTVRISDISITSLNTIDAELFDKVMMSLAANRYIKRITIDLQEFLESERAEQTQTKGPDVVSPLPYFASMARLLNADKAVTILTDGKGLSRARTRGGKLHDPDIAKHGLMTDVTGDKGLLRVDLSQANVQDLSNLLGSCKTDAVEIGGLTKNVMNVNLLRSALRDMAKANPDGIRVCFPDVTMMSDVFLLELLDAGFDDNTTFYFPNMSESAISARYRDLITDASKRTFWRGKAIKNRLYIKIGSSASEERGDYLDHHDWVAPSSK